MSTLIIQPTDTILSAQEQFEKVYPYLKIEFFKGEHEVGQLSKERFKIESSKTFREVLGIVSESEFDISPELTVAEFEQLFRELFKVSLQVYRKSGRVYLETSTTDSWTLEQQNHEGKEMSELV